MKWKTKHIKIECTRLKPDRGQSVRRGGAGLGRLAHVGGQVAHSWAYFSPTLASVVFGPLLSEFHDFGDRILSCCCGVFAHTCFPVYLYAQHVETKHISQRNRE